MGSLVVRSGKGIVVDLVLIKELKRDDKIKPPAPTKLRGRPLKKHIRKGRWTRKKSNTCSVCQSTDGHNKRTCRNEPVSNGRAQRRRDNLRTSADKEESEESEGSPLSDFLEYSDSGNDDADNEAKVDRFWNAYRVSGRRQPFTSMAAHLQHEEEE
jgi:hypothetical protein